MFGIGEQGEERLKQFRINAGNVPTHAVNEQQLQTVLLIALQSTLIRRFVNHNKIVAAATDGS